MENITRIMLITLALYGQAMLAMENMSRAEKLAKIKADAERRKATAAEGSSSSSAMTSTSSSSTAPSLSDIPPFTPPPSFNPEAGSPPSYEYEGSASTSSLTQPAAASSSASETPPPKPARKAAAQGSSSSSTTTSTSSSSIQPAATITKPIASSSSSSSSSAPSRSISPAVFALPGPLPSGEFYATEGYSGVGYDQKKIVQVTPLDSTERREAIKEIKEIVNRGLSVQRDQKTRDNFLLQRVESAANSLRINRITLETIRAGGGGSEYRKTEPIEIYIHDANDTFYLCYYASLRSQMQNASQRQEVEEIFKRTFGLQTMPEFNEAFFNNLPLYKKSERIVNRS